MLEKQDTHHKQDRTKALDIITESDKVILRNMVERGAPFDKVTKYIKKEFGKKYPKLKKVTRQTVTTYIKSGGLQKGGILSEDMDKIDKQIDEIYREKDKIVKKGLDDHMNFNRFCKLIKGANDTFKVKVEFLRTAIELYSITVKVNNETDGDIIDLPYDGVDDEREIVTEVD